MGAFFFILMAINQSIDASLETNAIADPFTSRRRFTHINNPYPPVSISRSIEIEGEKMPGLTCNACNMEFKDEEERNLHYKSDWHRYNLKRKVNFLLFSLTQFDLRLFLYTFSILLSK